MALFLHLSVSGRWCALPCGGMVDAGGAPSDEVERGNGTACVPRMGALGGCYFSGGLSGSNGAARVGSFRLFGTLSRT